ncbi:Rpn family recombination-promoting nuclease/putative transposase [Castellaniella caeni]
MPACKRPPIVPVSLAPSHEDSSASDASKPDLAQSSPDPGASPAQAAPVNNDYDSPWKDALELYFPQALALLAPDLYAVIDWSVAPVFLDKELQAIEIPDGPPGDGRLYADKLVQVRHLSGTDAWILVHVEVQSGDTGPQEIGKITYRMYRYRTRIEDRHEALSARAGKPPPSLFSLCILVASRSGPDHLEYESQFLGQGVRFSFPVVHLSQWLGRWGELKSLARTNPFAVVIMAQLQALRHHGARRVAPVLSLARLLYEYGYARDQVRSLLRLIEWMLRLPKDQEPIYLAALKRVKQERKMSYVLVAERLGMEKGRAKGQAEGRIEGRVEGQAELLLLQIERRFGPVAGDVTQRVRCAQAKDLETWSLNFVDAATLDDVFGD